MRQVVTVGSLVLGILLALPTSGAWARRGRAERPRPSDIRRGMKPVIPWVQACARHARVRASIRAQVVLSGAMGRVTSVVLKGQRLPKQVARCVRLNIRRLRVDRFRRASFRFTWPFLFRYGAKKAGRGHMARKGHKARRGALPKRLSMTQIRAGLYPVRLKVFRCNDKRRVKASYKLRIRIRGATGRVHDIHFLKSTLPKWLARCVRRAYRSARFPRFSRASQTIIQSKRLP